MKRIYYDKDGRVRKPYFPFWQPWGPWGCLWRTLLFLTGLVIICFLISLLRGCHSNDPFKSGGKDDPFREPSDTLNLPEELRDSSIVEDWNDSIPGVPELPDPEDNYIPPIDSSRIIVNPEDTLSQIVADQLFVIFNSQDLKKDMADFARQFKQIYPDPAYKVQYYNPTIGTMVLTVPQDRVNQVANELPQRITGIDFRVATNEILEDGAKPGDPGFSIASYDEYFRLIQAYEAWDITRGSKDIKVGIVDSYFDLTHPEIGTRYTDPIHIPTRTRNVQPPARRPTSEGELTAYCHGSHVAGIAIGEQNNNIGCSGIAPECTWIPISLGTQLTTANMIEGILYAIYHGADVVNFSMGRAYPSNIKGQIPLGDQVAATQSSKLGEELWKYVVKVANDHRCVLVTSAGNSTLLSGMDPKNRSNDFIKVEAVDGKGQMAPFSNFGIVKEAGLNYSTVAAPGVKLWSATDKRCTAIWKKLGFKVSEKDGLQEMDGTSMAAPVVTGAVALLKSKKKDLTTDQVIKILTMTAKQTDTTHPIGPTIQIKDALDATGGELLNFDDLMKNHDLIIGKWRSTNELSLNNADTGAKIDDMWTYLIFTSTSEGRVEHHTINSRRIYTARLSVKWEQDRIVLIQDGDAVSKEGDTVNHDDYVCIPNKDRMLEAYWVRFGKKRGESFLMEKVN